MVRNSRIIAQSAIHKMAARAAQSVQLTGLGLNNQAAVVLFPGEVRNFSSAASYTMVTRRPFLGGTAASTLCRDEECVKLYLH
jgi:hypothetical protein